MKLELTPRETRLILFFLSLLVLGATIQLVRSGADWTRPVEALRDK